MNLIKALQNLEPVFIKAGKLAQEMQKGVGYHNKYATGNATVDIVTEADLAVQELLLQAMAKTELVNCRLLAEEDTVTTKKFNDHGNYYLTIDPIDGTQVYANNGKIFSVIISLHDGKNLLYTFVHFPVLNWTHRIIDQEYTTSGQPPEFAFSPQAKNSIIYWRGHPEKTIPVLYQELKNQGLNFAGVEETTNDFHSIGPFSCGKVAGFYEENINAYDGLVELHIAKARGLKIHTGGGFDLLNIKKRESGFYYPGYYLVLN